MRRNEPGDSKVGHALPMVHPNAAAIDVGARMHVAAVGADCTAEPVRSFGTFTTDLHRLVDWFAECGVETVVMESTSVYWIPIFELLEARGFEVLFGRRGNLLSSHIDDVGDASLQRHASVGSNDGQIAGVEEAVLEESLRRRFVIEIAGRSA